MKKPEKHGIVSIVTPALFVVFLLLSFVIISKQMSIQQNLVSQAAAPKGNLDSQLVKRPSSGDNCTTEYKPICGTDNKTYANACLAKQKSATALCNTECPCALDSNGWYFRFTDASKKYFIMKVNSRTAGQARQIIALKQNKIPNGIIVKSAASYNPGWSFTYNPSSVQFVDSAIETCDATMQMIQNHLSDVGGSLLPNNRWCPWSARLVNEIIIRR